MKYYLLLTGQPVPAGMLEKRSRGVRIFYIGDNLEWAMSWKTKAGAERFAKAETDAGSNWTYTVLPCRE